MKVETSAALTEKLQVFRVVVFVFHFVFERNSGKYASTRILFGGRIIFVI